MQQIDGPKLPPLLQMLQWVLRPVSFLEECSKQYGDPFQANFGYGPIVFFSDPQAVEAILTLDPKLFDSSRGNLPLLPVVGGRSVLLLEGEEHRQRRRLLLPPFHGERMRGYAEVIVAATEEVIGRWKPDQPIIVRSALQEITLRVIIQAIFGVGKEQETQVLMGLIEELLELTRSPWVTSTFFLPKLRINLGSTSPWGRFLRKRSELDRYIYALIDERRRESAHERTDILSLLMATQDEQGQHLKDNELRDELMTLLLAGHETSATALEWALYSLHTHFASLKNLRAELERGSSDPTEIARLPYLNAVYQETLRICSLTIIPMLRLTKSALSLAGHEIAPGTRLAACIYLTHQRPEIYPEPWHFRPERFLERQYSSYEFYPFGGGNRRCIGMAFAQFEIKLILATILKHFKLRLQSASGARPIRKGATLAPSVKTVLVIDRD